MNYEYGEDLINNRGGFGMTEKYTATITNDHYDFHKKYWKVEVKANSLEELNRVCEQIRSLKE